MDGCAATCTFPPTNTGCVHLWQPALNLAVVSQAVLVCVVAEMGRVVLEKAAVGRVGRMFRV